MYSRRDRISYACTALVFAFVTIILLAGASQAQTLIVLHNFTGGPDGANPFGTLIMDSSGNLYGTASSGANGSCVFIAISGCGTAFKMTNKSGKWGFSTLYKFEASTDGAAPLAPLTIGPDDKLYGTTNNGGEGPCAYLGDTGCGTVFELPVTAEPAADKVLYRFSGGDDGGVPLLSGVVFVGNTMFGTTAADGDLSCNSGEGCGTVFSVSATGKETVLHAFTGAGGDGASPLAGLVADKEGNLYGTTASGGGLGNCTNGCGTIFEMVRSQSGWTEKILYAFTGTADGENPNGGLILDSRGDIYGTTWQGGGGSGGTAWELHKNASGSWSLFVLTSFETSGFTTSPLVMDSKGDLFGTTQNGGTFNFGRIFELIPNPKGFGYKELYDFTGAADGGNPLGGLVLDSAGNLYGTTAYDGSGGCGGSGCGVVFEFTP
jgi:uncharacterized repeat protein (TIGR03803 family)